MSTTTPRQTPSRTDTSSLNPNALEYVDTAVENRSEKDMINISKEATESLKSKVKGQIVLPSDSTYDEVRQIWNAMIERRPALIVRCTEADDVPHAILFAREYGLEISIRGADSKRIRASENENADLFWAIRGGGGNFGVVTQFEFNLHRVGPEILAGLIVFPFDQAKQVLTQYREYVESAAEELNWNPITSQSSVMAR
jgi:FAD/FMN-containing dehydrogenase